jgi:hypothetical protein
MKHRHQRRSDCPINFALETFGDPWSLLLIRDIVYFGKKTCGEFFASEEGMANWSTEHDPHTAASAAWIALMKADRDQMIRLMRETVQSGGSVFAGEKNLLSTFMGSGSFEKDSPVEIVAMEKEQKTRLVHEL